MNIDIFKCPYAILHLEYIDILLKPGGIYAN